MTWQPEPMQLEVLDEFYAQRSDGVPLPADQRVLHPLAAQCLRDAEDTLYERSGDDWDGSRPILCFHSMTRTIDFQYTLAKRNRVHRSAKFPNGIPTATIGASMHQFGLAVDINMRETFRRINVAQIDFDLDKFRQFLAGHFLVGIRSENWHYNCMLREMYSDWPGHRLRDHIYAKNYTNLSDEQKVTLFKLAGIEGHNLEDMTINFQTAYSASLKVDGIPGTRTCRAAYCRWAHSQIGK